MSLLGNLMSQVARSAMNSEVLSATHQPTYRPASYWWFWRYIGQRIGKVTRTGGEYNPRQYNHKPDNGFGLDDIIGGLAGGNDVVASAQVCGLGDI